MSDEIKLAIDRAVAHDLPDVADLLERIGDENRKLREERDDARRLLEQSQAAEMRMFDRAEKAEQERDALAATVESAAEMIRRCDYTPARSVLLQAMQGKFCILAARDARVKAEALREAEVCGRWIDPNDKTQQKFLPWVGEECLFSHGGVTYYGKHTGGSFQTGHGATARNFCTWECFWMPLPKAQKMADAIEK